MQGAIVNGYQLKRLLGRGGMAEVWYAENEIGKAAAVKILNENLTHNQQIVERFHNEALIMVKLEHPNIRQVYSYGYLGDRHCIIMEYLEGDDLEALMKSGRRFTDEELRTWWNQTVDALNYTHAMGIVHRDIKPSNIFLDKRGNIKLLDFGIAKVKETMSMTRTGTMMGTLMYMSPEQVMDSKNIDYHTDIYSLAVTFVHLLSGKAPYDSDTTGDYAVRKGIVEQDFDLSAVPNQWRGFLRPYLAKDPGQRPPLRPFEFVQDIARPRPVVGQSTMVGDTYNNGRAQATVVGTSQPLSSAPAPMPASAPVDEHKSKAGLWIGLGVGGGVLLLLLLVLLLRPKPAHYEPSVQSSQPITQTQSTTPTTASTTTTTQTTATPAVSVPYGAAKGVFSVGYSKQVYFAKGNLQYQASTGAWRFAGNQWEALGSSNTNISSSYSGWIDLFSWGTGNYPYSFSQSDADYSSFYDWGVYGMGDGWRTPSKEEWNYLFTGRPNAYSKYGAARVNGVAGIVVLPDDWTTPSGLSFYSTTNYSQNTYDNAAWSRMEDAGAIFLPAAGRRTGKQMFNFGNDCDYWSSSPNGSTKAYNVDLTYGKSLLPQDNSPRKHGFAVRLIKDK